MQPVLPPPRVRTLQALAASRRKFGRVSGTGGRQARWAHCRSREVLQGLSQQQAEPAQAQELAQVAARAAVRAAARAQELVQPVAAAGLVRARWSQVAGQRAAAQLLWKGAAQHNRTTSGMRRSRLLK